MIERKFSCPKCGKEMLALSGEKVICLNRDCNWEIEARRDEDKKLPKAIDVINEFNQ